MPAWIRRLWPVRTRRPLQVAAIAVAIAVGYEAAVNLFLMTGALGRALSDDPDTLIVDYASGWMVVPGRVHATGLRIRSRDSHVEFQLNIDRCSFDVSLLDLTRRRFRVTRVEGDGVRFRARRRIAVADVTETLLAALPPIDDFEPVPLKGLDSPPPDDAHYKLWTVELDRVDARGTREIWVDAVRFVGEARVRGGFFLRPVRWASVGPVVAEVRAGRIVSGDDPIASEVAGQLEVTVDGFDPRVTDGAGVLHRLTARVAAEAAVDGISFVRHWLGDGGPALGGGAGRASFDLGVDHGRLAPPSRVALDLDALRARGRSRSIGGDVHAVASVQPGQGGGVPGAQLEASIEGRGLLDAEEGLPGAGPRIPRADVHLASGELDLAAHPLSDAVWSVHVPRLEIPDARVVNAWLDGARSVRVDGGRGAGSIDLELSRGIGHGSAALALDAVRIERDGGPGPACLLGSVETRLAVRDLRPGQGAMDFTGSRVEARDVTVGSTRGWWAGAEVVSGSLATRPAFALRARVNVRARDARPLAQEAMPGGLPAWVVGIVSTDDLRGSGELRVGPGRIALDDAKVTAGPFAVEGSYRAREQRSRALLLVEDGPLAVGVEREDETTHVQLLGARAWFAERRLVTQQTTSSR